MAMQVSGDLSLHQVFLLMDKEIVRSLIPDWAELMDIPFLPEDKHPLAIGFAHEKNVRFEWGFIKSFGSEFREIGLGVPYLKLKKSGSGPWYTYGAIYINDWLATIAGRYWWGFNKLHSNVQTENNDDFYAVTHKNKFILSAEFENSGSVGKAKDFPHFQELIEHKLLVECPVIDRTPVGIFMSTQFQINWNEVAVQPVKSKMEISDIAIPGLKKVGFETDGIDTSSLGSFNMTCHWTMSMPKIVPNKAPKNLK